jgi:DNA repair exonuclease SbcCD ATPase subunit
MHFKKLTIRNFLSLAEADVSFESGIHLIHGVNYDMGADGQESNGSGKSSIMDALLWCLYGCLNRPKGNSNSVINSAAGKDCRVEVEFEHEGETFRVARFRKDSEDGNGVRWWRSGKEMTASQARESQRDLEATLPVSAGVFKHAIQVGQGMPDKFLDLTESAKQDLLCQMVDLGMYDRALDRTKQDIAEVTTAVTMTEGTLRGLYEQITNWESELAQAQAGLAAYESQTSDQMTELQATVGACEGQLTDLNARVETLRATAAPADAQAKSAQERATEATRTVQAIFQRGSTLKASHTALENEKARIAARPTHCPTCRQAIEVADMAERLAEIETEQSGLLAGQHALACDYRTAKGTADRATVMATQAQSAVSRINAEVYQLQAQITTVAHKRDAAASQLQGFTRQVDTLRSKVELTSQSIEKMRESLAPNEERLKDLKNQLLHWQYWKESIPGLRASAIEEVLGFINERLAHYMDIFSSGAMGVKLYQEQHGKGSRIKVDLKTAAETYGMSSGGEKRRVDLALYLSLSDLLQASSGIKCNVLAADEICDGLSPLGVQQFLDVLSGKAVDTCVFVVSHNPAVSQNFEFDSIKVVEKKSGRARLLL